MAGERLAEIAEQTMEWLEHEATPEQKEAFRREFIFANTAGIISSALPDEQTGEVDAGRATVRERAHARLRESVGIARPQSALETVRLGLEILVEEYRAYTGGDPAYQYEFQIAEQVLGWSLSDRQFDEELAQRVLDYAGLPGAVNA